MEGEGTEATNSAAAPASPAATPNAGAPAGDRALRLQILSLENATLLAHRSQLWSDAAGRAAMYVAILSGAIVTLALAAQATAFGQGFVIFALLLLPVVLYAGLVTVGRLAEIDNAEFRVVQGLNRIQHGVLELDPSSEPYLASSPHDDWQGISLAFTTDEPVGSRAAIAHGLRTLPALLAVINATIAAVLAGVIGIQLGLAAAFVIAGGVVVFVVFFVTQGRWALKRIDAVRRSLVSFYPFESAPVEEGTVREP